jgi:hypothetical protein
VISFPPSSFFPSYPKLSYILSYVLPSPESGVDLSRVSILGLDGYKRLHDDVVADDVVADDVVADDDAPTTPITLTAVTFQIPYACGRLSPSSPFYPKGDACNWSNSGFGVTTPATPSTPSSTYFCCKPDYLNRVPTCDADNLNLPLLNDHKLKLHHGAKAHISLDPSAVTPTHFASLTSFRNSNPAVYSEPGYYVTAIITCDDLSQILPISGSLSITSNDSLLPGTQTDIDRFYIAYTVLTALLLLSYAVTMQRNHTSDRLSLHSHMAALLCILFIESFCYTVLYSIWSDTGTRPNDFKLFCLVISVAKRTAIRFILITMCLGLGISTPTLHKQTWLVIILLSVAYFSSSLLYMFLTNLDAELSNGDDKNASGTIILQLFIAVVNIVMYVYIFEGLMQTIKTLKEDKQKEKCKSYLQFRKVLSVTVITAVIFTVVSIIDYFHPIEQVGGYVWFFDDNWVEVVYILLSAAVAFIFRPRARIGSLADMIELSNMDSDDEDGDNDWGNVIGEEEDEGFGNDDDVDVEEGAWNNGGGGSVGESTKEGTRDVGVKKGGLDMNALRQMADSDDDDDDDDRL